MTSKEVVNLFKRYLWAIPFQPFKDRTKAIEILEELVEKAQKQEKLLKLYRELDDCIVAPGGHHVCRYTDDEKYARIRKKIKELENE